ncbi:uncharacterized protein E0L32_001074 [Thyridium curvatum]|uniref:Oxidoreductase n=1 Tax=Thyridium curvatum TaxID=1093900 RepID=A0A507AWY7_9PEZI|nr:uncharacterized protein E0L32_001074 [Thyridium curvatum]TPX11256.1 hypothetical protein E0L32_001074 [Thyridium curvatum]
MSPSPSSKVRFAVIGTGLIGPRHAQTVAKHKEADLVAIVDPAPAGANVAKQLDVTYYKSISDLVQSTDKPDAAIISTPNHTHVAVARELAAAGIHILIEKPVSTDIPSGEALVKELDKSPIKALVGHHRRWNSYMVAAKRIVDSGKLGTVLAVNGLWTSYKPLDYFDPPAEWRKLRTGGVVYLNMVHEVDLLHFLFGPISSVHAEHTMAQRGFEAKEGAALTLRFKSGVVASFILSDHAPSPYNFEAGTGENHLIPKTGQDFYRVFGTNGCLSVPDMTVWSYKGATKSWHSELNQERLPVTEDTPFDNQLGHFVQVIRGQQAPSCTVQAGLAALIVCEAIDKAMQDNSTVEIVDYML